MTADIKKVEGQAAVVPAETDVEEAYFFPTHGKTILAKSKEEAEKKLVEVNKAELTPNA